MKKNFSLIISILAPMLIIGAAVFFVRTNIATRGQGVLTVGQNDTPSIANVAIVDGKQIISFTAKGGFSPHKTLAKSGIPTVLRFTTTGTFDCSSVVRVPSLGIRESLPQTGSTDIAIGTPENKILYGTCGMGMYPFEITFQS